MKKLCRSLGDKVLWVLVLATAVDLAQGHPQCLSWNPPFNASLSFCSQYSGFGCCSQEDEKAVIKEYQHLQGQLSAIWSNCSGDIKDILCMRCSPYAAHLYDAEVVRGALRALPGLCRNQCRSFYNRCFEAIEHLDPAKKQKGDLGTVDSFCQALEIVDMDYCYPALLTNPLFNSELTNVQKSVNGCLCLEPIVTDLKYIVLAKHAGDGSGRLFVAEQAGKIYIVNVTSKTYLSRPFLDIQSNVLFAGVDWDERGLLGLAFHKNYSSNGRFYVFYSTSLGRNNPGRQSWWTEEWTTKSRISEFRVSRDDPNVADHESERIILEVEQPFFNHNGGEILFGDDGYLYIFVGDGGNGGDPFNFAQNKSVLMGKVLRVDVDSDPSQPYTMPPDNPFVNESGTRPEIFAYGIRNTWRCGKDTGDKNGVGKGRVICGDVGQSAHEELNLLKKGANYGWNIREGIACFKNQTLCDAVETEPPIYDYLHVQGKSVTGGNFYRGCRNPSLYGYYIYGDYMTGRMFKLLETTGGQWENEEIFMCTSCPAGTTGTYERFIYSFGEDEGGEVYMLTTGQRVGATSDTSSLFRILDPTSTVKPEDCVPTTSTRKPANMSVDEARTKLPTKSPRTAFR